MEIIHHKKSVEKKMNSSRNQTLPSAKTIQQLNYTCFRVFSTLLEIIRQKKSITVTGLIVQNILIKIKLYSGIKATWQVSYTWFIFWAFRQTGKTWKKTPNNLGYTENISKSPTPHSASDKVFRLIFIQTFYAINLIWWSIFNLGMHIN